MRIPLNPSLAVTLNNSKELSLYTSAVITADLGEFSHEYVYHLVVPDDLTLMDYINIGRVIGQGEKSLQVITNLFK